MEAALAATSAASSLGHRVRNDPGSGMHGGHAVPDDRAADRDRALDVRRREVADRPAVRPAALALQLRDGLHRAHLRRTPHRPGREDGAHRIEGVQPVRQAPVHLRHQVHHVGVTLDVAERGDLDAGGCCDAADVVAGKVDEHRVLCELLWIGAQLCLQRGVEDRILVPRPGPGDRPRDDLAISNAHEQLRRGTDHGRARRDRREVQVVQVRRGVDPAQ